MRVLDFEWISNLRFKSNVCSLYAKVVFKVQNLGSFRNSYRFSLIRFSGLMPGGGLINCFIPTSTSPNATYLTFSIQVEQAERIDFFEKMVSKLLLLIGIIVALSVNSAEADAGCSSNLCWASCKFPPFSWCWTKLPDAPPGTKDFPNIRHCGKDSDCNEEWPCADTYFCFYGPRVD